MPQINLLAPGRHIRGGKEEEQKESEGSLPFHLALKIPAEFLSVLLPILIRSSVCITVCVTIWIILAVDIGKKQKISKQLKRETGALKSNPSEMQKVEKQRVALEKKVQLIDQLSSRDFFWYKRLDVFADLIPEGIWLTSISANKAGASSKTKTKRSSKSKVEKAASGTMLVVNGTSVAYKIQDAVRLIRTFIKNLQGDEDFSKYMSGIELEKIAKSTFGGLDVMNFTILCKLKGQDDDSTKNNKKK